MSRTPRRDHATGPDPAAPAALTPSGFFALRTPLLPLVELHDLGADLAAPHVPDGDRAALEAALASDRARVRDRLRAAVLRPEVREAIFLASPSLDESLDVWLRDPDGERGQKVERALSRYFARMCARPTPFGLFAACSVGEIAPRDDETRLHTAARAAASRHSRLDMDFLFALTEALERAPEVRAALPHRWNTSLCRAAARLRCAAARTDADKVRTYHLVSAPPTPYLEATLLRAQHGALPGDLAAALTADDPEVAPDEAAAYVSELIDAQLLTADLAPRVTGDEPIHELCDRLRALPEPAAACAARLDAAARALADLDAGGIGASPARYRDIAAGLDGLPAPAELPRLFQVDLFKPAPEARLGRAVVDEIRRGVEILRRIARPRDELRPFAEAFVLRYGDEEVPLLEALDEESGVGFHAAEAPGAAAEPLIAGITFPAGDEEGPRFGARDALLLGKLSDALRSGARAISLTNDDIDQLAARTPPPLPDACAALAAVAADSDEALAAGRFLLHLASAAGPSGALLLGRFCHGDPGLLAAVHQHTRAEEALRPDAVFAEVVHLPHGRLGNVLLRPLLRDHEIPFLGRSGAPPERQLLPADLTVSIVDERVVLRSRRLQREVIPRLTTAHNFGGPQNLGTYRFLCALAGQGVAQGVSWDWGPLAHATFLPRVTAGDRLILSLARWRLGAADLKRLAAPDAAARFAAARELSRALGLPRFVELSEADNELPVDFDNPLSVESFAHQVKDRPFAVLVEPFPPPDALCARAPEGRFTHEIVVPFVRGETAIPRPRDIAPLPPAFPRRLPPGSDWLQARLYAGTAAADQVLREVVAPVVARAAEAGAADAWFFIRYTDPEWHLRLRFHGDPEALRSLVQPDLTRAAAPLISDGRIWSLQLGTYDREVQRYGGPASIALAERIFHADSEAVLGVVGLLEGDAGADARWRLALRGADQLLDDLGLDLAAKTAVVARARADFGRRHDAGAPLPLLADGPRASRAGKALDRQLGERYRKERLALESLLDRNNDTGSEYEPGLSLLARRSEVIAPIAAELRALERAGRLSSPVEEQAGSYVHMFLNRMFRAAALAQELVVYDFLNRLYEGQRARARNKQG